MNDFKNNIDKMVSKILSEEIEKKSKQISEQLKEELSTGQKEIAKQAEPKDKITGADFKKLRDAKKHKKEVEEYYHSNSKDYDDNEEDFRKRYKMMDEPSSDDGDYSGMRNVMKKRYNKDMGISDDEDFAKSDKEEMDEFYFYDDEEDESTPGDYEGDEEEEEEAEELSAQEPTYVGKGLADNKIKNKIRNKIFGSFNEEDGETQEGNAFSGALDKAKKNHDKSFEVDGHTYPVKEARDKFDGKKSKVIGVYSNIKKQREMKEDDDKWIQKTHMKKGALHKKLGIPEGDKIPQSKLKSLKAELHKKSEGDKKLSVADSKLLKQVNLALTLKSVKESKNSLRLSETELIDMIESLVLEQKVKDAAEKNNISKKEATGLKKTEKVLGKNKSEGDSYFKELAKKMTDYLKDSTSSTKEKYVMNPESFPQSNYDMEKEHNEMKYHPSEAVEEYIEAFSYPGMTNLVYDEIKPDDKRIDKQLKGDSMFGNAVTDKDGKALGNVVPSKVGERFKKNYDDNLYGAEQQKASYKRQKAPVEVEGNGKTKGSLKSKQQGADKSSSIAKATKILNTLESTENKKEKRINEDMEKMKNLIGYNRKTQ